eukprot:2853676-Rhodomonas_salina.1
MSGTDTGHSVSYASAVCYVPDMSRGPGKGCIVSVPCSANGWNLVKSPAGLLPHYICLRPRYVMPGSDMADGFTHPRALLWVVGFFPAAYVKPKNDVDAEK